MYRVLPNSKDKFKDVIERMKIKKKKKIPYIVESQINHLKKNTEYSNLYQLWLNTIISQKLKYIIMKLLVAKSTFIADMIISNKFGKYL